MLFTDDYVIDDVGRRTGDGYLVAASRVARTGIQIYSGKEMGKPEMDTVRVYRPEDEVFSVNSMKSFANKPITLGHPPQPVNSSSWRDKAVGSIGEDVVRDGQYVRVPMLLMDENVIDSVERGRTRQLSMGYTCDIAWEKGVSPAGEAYDAVQRNIRINHLAVVKNARGGDKLRVGDNAEEHWLIDLGDGEYFMDPNPWHGRGGRFARKGEGEFVPTEGYEGGEGSGGNRTSKALVPSGSESSSQNNASGELPEARSSTRPAPSRAWFTTQKEAEEHIRQQRAKWARARAVRHVHLKTEPPSGWLRRRLGLGGKRTAEERYEVRAGLDGQNAGDVREFVLTDAVCPECGHKISGSEETCPECGYELEDAIVDNQGEMEMSKTITVDGISCEMSDTAAQVVQRTVASLEQKLKDSVAETEAEKKKREEAEKKGSTDSATLQTQVAQKDAEIATLKKQLADATLTPQQIDALVADRGAVIARAKAILGDKVVVDGKTAQEIRRQVVDASLGDVAKGWTDDQVSASFGTLTSNVKLAAADGVNDLARGFSFQQNTSDARVAAYSEYDTSLQNAWMGGKAA